MMVALNSIFKDPSAPFEDVVSRLYPAAWWLRPVLFFLPHKTTRGPDRTIYVYEELFGRTYRLTDSGYQTITTKEYLDSFS
jgi:hypothetical protein